MIQNKSSYAGSWNAPEKSCKVLSVNKVEVVTRTENAPGEAATEYGKMIRSVCRTHSAECSIPTAFRHLFGVNSLSAGGGDGVEQELC